MSDGPAFMKDSICRDCKYKIKRIVIPTDGTDWQIDIYDEDKYYEALENGEEINFEHIMCKKLHIDLDHIVLECDCFEQKMKDKKKLITHEKILDLVTNDLLKDNK